MHKTFIAGLMALLLSLTPAVPTQAQGLNEDDIGKILFGLLAVGVIGAAISNRDRQDDAVPVQQRQPRSQHRNDRDQGRNWSNGNHRGQNRAAPAVLPMQCFERYETRRGVQSIFGRACMRRNYSQFRNLPQDCLIRVRTDQGRRPGYDAQCLRDYGYSGLHRR